MNKTLHVVVWQKHGFLFSSSSETWQRIQALQIQSLSWTPHHCPFILSPSLNCYSELVSYIPHSLSYDKVFGFSPEMVQLE